MDGTFELFAVAVNMNRRLKIYSFINREAAEKMYEIQCQDMKTKIEHQYLHLFYDDKVKNPTPYFNNGIILKIVTTSNKKFRITLEKYYLNIH